MEKGKGVFNREIREIREQGKGVRQRDEWLRACNHFSNCFPFLFSRPRISRISRLKNSPPFPLFCNGDFLAPQHHSRPQPILISFPLSAVELFLFAPDSATRIS